VHDIVEEKTKSALGIIVAGTGFPTNNIIANNMIYNVRSNGTSGEQGAGIGIAFGNADKVVFNSILMEGDIDPASSTTATGSNAGIRISSSFNAPNLTLKNNIISVDLNSNTSSLNHYAIVIPSTTYSWGSGGLDYNDYYVNSSNTQMKIGGTGTSIPYTAVSDFATWQTTLSPNRDANSKNFAPDFISATDLHLNLSSENTNYLGTPITGVTADFDGDARNASFPYIGADENLGFPLPVELVSLNIEYRTGNVELRWKTATEVNNAGWEVQRSVVRGQKSESANGRMSEWVKAGFVEGNGNSSAPKEYSFIDRNLSKGKYSYRLKQIDRDGKFKYSQEVAVEVGSGNAPKIFALAQNYPNPFNPTTTIGFTLEKSGMTTLKIYDAIGREVATLVKENLEAGVYHQKIFDASRFSSGIYFARLQSGDKMQTKKLMLLK